MNLKAMAALFFAMLPCLNATAQDSLLLPASGGEIIKRKFYSLAYSEQHEQPAWVAYRLSPDMLRKVYDRKDSFRTDPDVTTGSASYDDYKSAPDYDAGHLLPCRQMQFDCDAMSETFYMSNMSPQHKDFNRYQWAYLERLERNMAWTEGGLFVITGPVLEDSLPTIGVTSRIAIPRYFYRVLLVDHHPDHPKVLGFVLPNERNNLPLQSFVVSIDSIEQLTGIDMFPLLDDSLENILESQVRMESWTFSNANNNFGYTEPVKKCTSGNVRNPVVVAKKINLNQATLIELQQLPGIGPAKAQAIIEGRPYRDPLEITRVKGIGILLYEKIKDLISTE